MNFGGFMKRLILLLIPMLFAGCMTAESAKKASTYKLCDVMLTVTTQSSVIAAENELKARGENCDRYVNAIMANEQRRMAGFAELNRLGESLRQQSQPKTLSDPVPMNQPMNCRVIRGGYVDRVECK
jgi:hypothetical protein